MPRETHTPLEFPLGGIDTSTEYQGQPPGTTADAVNVRAQDPLKEMFRGGSRHGLSKLLPDQVNGNAPIQSLSVLVSVDPEALTTDYREGDARSLPSQNPDFVEDVDWVTDPSTNNDANGVGGERNPGSDRAVPQGGSGRPPRRTAAQVPPEAFCRTYHVASGFEESFSEVTICTSAEFPLDFTSQAGGNGGTYIAPGPNPPTLGELVAIIQAADENEATPYDDFTDEPE